MGSIVLQFIPGKPLEKVLHNREIVVFSFTIVTSASSSSIPTDQKQLRNSDWMTVTMTACLTRIIGWVHVDRVVCKDGWMDG